MSETNRVLDLDAGKTIPVKIGDREFVLRRQRRAILEKVVRAMQSEEDRSTEMPESEDKDKGQKILTISFQRWANAIPIIALMFGYEEDNKETPEIINHLEEFLSFPDAIEIYTAWYGLNRLDGFFWRVGNPFLLDSLVEKVLQDVEAGSETTPTSLSTT
jgi:hypothetical protein